MNANAVEFWSTVERATRKLAITREIVAEWEAAVEETARERRDPNEPFSAARKARLDALWAMYDEAEGKPAPMAVPS